MKCLFIRLLRLWGNLMIYKTYKAKINYKDLKVNKYYYDAPSGSSVGVNIFFDAKLEKVVRIECKD